MVKNNSDKKVSVTENEPKKAKPKRGNPYEVIQIYDTSCNKIRKARNFSVLSFEEHDKNGKPRMGKSVEFIVVGNNRTWKMFIPYDEFVEANPSVDLPGESK